MLRKSNFRVVALRLGRGQQDDFALRLEPLAGDLNQLFSYAPLLIFHVHCQIGKVTAVTEIGQRTRHANEQFTVPRRAGKIRVREHVGDASVIVHRAAFTERRSHQDVDELLARDFLLT